jgi:hypothetical protein
MLSTKSFASFLHGTRNLAIQSIILDFLTTIVDSMEEVIYSELKYQFLPDSNTDLSALRSYFVRASVYNNLAETAETIDNAFVYIQKQLGVPSDPLVDSALLDLSSGLSENWKIAKQLISKENRRYELFKRALDVQDSQNVMILTTLAAVFLPVSLASSLLGMQTRVLHLGFLLYDFTGVCVLLGTLVLLTYPFLKRVLATISHRRWYKTTGMFVDSLTESRKKSQPEP